jgi:hypothetical protein
MFTTKDYIVRGGFVSEQFGFVMVTEPLTKPCCENTSLLNKCSTALFHRWRLNSTTVRPAAPFRKVELPSFRVVPHHGASLWVSSN